MLDTYYTVLGISETATQKEIKAAYRELMKQVHPDAVPKASPYWKQQAEEKSKEVTEAYRVLSNTVQRSLYDRNLADLRRASQPHTQAAPAPQPKPAPTPQPIFTCSVCGSHTKVAGTTQCYVCQQSKQTAPTPQPQPAAKAAPIPKVVYWPIAATAFLIFGCFVATIIVLWSQPAQPIATQPAAAQPQTVQPVQPVEVLQQYPPAVPSQAATKVPAEVYPYYHELAASGKITEYNTRYVCFFSYSPNEVITLETDVHTAGDVVLRAYEKGARGNGIPRALVISADSKHYLAGNVQMFIDWKTLRFTWKPPNDAQETGGCQYVDLAGERKAEWRAFVKAHPEAAGGDAVSSPVTVLWARAHGLDADVKTKEEFCAAGLNRESDGTSEEEEEYCASTILYFADFQTWWNTHSHYKKGEEVPVPKGAVSIGKSTAEPKITITSFGDVRGPCCWLRAQVVQTLWHLCKFNWSCTDDGDVITVSKGDMLQLLEPICERTSGGQDACHVRVKHGGREWEGYVDSTNVEMEAQQ